MTYFLSAIAIIIAVTAIVFIHEHRREHRFHVRARKRRAQTVYRLYCACRRERYRTKIITRDERFAIGDGAWHTVRAEYPKGM